MTSREREVILPLCSGEASPGILHPDVESSAQERHGAVGARPEEVHQNDLRVKHFPYKDKLRELEHFSLEKAPGRPESGLSTSTGL